MARFLNSSVPIKYMYVDLWFSCCEASKHLYILWVLHVRRGGVPAEDLFAIYMYIVLILSVLEYCCVVWHHALPAYLSDSVERV